MARKVIVARYTAEELSNQEAYWRDLGAQSVLRSTHAEREALARQKAQLDMDQTKAVTDLLRAAGENLSKAGYLIGKLNKDNSR